MKTKDKKRSSHVRRRKLFSLSTSYHSVEHDDESCGDNGGLLQQQQQESSQEPMVVSKLHNTKLSSPEHPQFFSKDEEMCPSSPDGFFDLIGKRNFDFASKPIEENDPFTRTQTAPIVAGGSKTKETISVELTQQAQTEPKKRHSSLCEWPEDNMNEDLTEEVWQESSTAQPNGVAHPLTRNVAPAKAPTPEYVITGTIELKTADQPSGITFQKTDNICPLKIQGFSPFSQFKTKTNLKPGMVVLEINGREMTWESTKEAIVEIKKAKPGRVTIMAIAPSKITSAPKAVADRIANPPIALKKQENKFPAKKSIEATNICTKPPKPPVVQKKDLQVDVDDDESRIKTPIKTSSEGKVSEQTHYRDPSLMMMESTVTEATEDDFVPMIDVKKGGPSFKQLNPSFTRVDSAMTSDTGVSSPKRTTPVPLLGQVINDDDEEDDGNNDDDAVEMDVVYVGESYSDDEEEDEVVLPEEGAATKESSLSPKQPPTPKQSNTTAASGGFGSSTTNNYNKPPLPYRNGTRATKVSHEDPPMAGTQEPSSRSTSSTLKEESSSSSARSSRSNEKKKETDTKPKKRISVETVWDDEEEEDESSQGIFCHAIGGIHVSPMLTTMKDISTFANRFTERMPSWVRVLCHE
ncbi:unnamed protein product [Cylindrotheca closterium]|uniref:PDZ domain-containing protein n=1 Tax=Cylindrotheca closterium TaxID=2856 RepID=A0AAD2FJA4_9STRA|nr:unnamed protein product [Cylindrotheca closterium]